MPVDAQHFHLPAYREIPNVGLYLEQTTKYINECLKPLEAAELTGSMVSNYVKKGYVSRPIKKQYDANLIAQLLFVALSKQALPMEYIARLLEVQRQHYEAAFAYDYFCQQLEQVLRQSFGLEAQVKELAPDAPMEKRILRSLLIAVAQTIYLRDCFDRLPPENPAQAPQA